MSLGHTGRIGVLAVASILALTTLRAEEPELAAGALPATEAADRLLARLRYVRTDYPDTVADGQVVDAEEYAEQREILEEALALTGALPLSTATRTALGGLEASVERRAPGAEVTAACDALLARLGDELWLELDPPDGSRLAEGSRLYGANCAACHGVYGQGAPPGLGLSPAPVAFRDAAVNAQLSPRRVYEAVTFGVPETAMVARADAIAEADRWALAFYVAGMAAPPASEPVPALTLEELADTTNAALAEEAPPGVGGAAAVAGWRGPEVGAAAGSPWLAMRADVRAAEWRVRAAMARVSQAEAARYPSFALGGSLGLSAATLGALTQGASVLGSVLASASVPLFDAGANTAQVQAQEAALAQAHVA